MIPVEGHAHTRVRNCGYRRRLDFRTSQNTQIYEGTNQIQRVVMARALLKG